MNENAFINVTLNPGQSPAIFIRATSAAEAKQMLEDVASSGLYAAVAEARIAFKEATAEAPLPAPVLQ